MGEIRNQVNEFQGTLETLLMLPLDDTADKEQFIEYATALWESFREGKDIADFEDKDDIWKGYLDALIETLANLKHKVIKYSDEEG